MARFLEYILETRTQHRIISVKRHPRIIGDSVAEELSGAAVEGITRYI